MKLDLVISILATILLALVLSGCSSSQRKLAAGVVGVAHGGVIAFASDKDGTYDIYTINTDGSGLHQITSGPGQDLDPVWSPNGRQIAFLRRQGPIPPVPEPGVLFTLYVVNADGTGLHSVASDDLVAGYADWSPDSKQLVFECYRAKHSDPSQICVVDADGKSLRQVLPSSKQIAHSEPRWLPDGKTVVFVGGGAAPPGIYGVNADGTNLRPLKTVSSDALWFSISPDGTEIAYLELTKLYVMNVDGSNAKRIDIGRWILSPEAPQWSPDSQQLAFVGWQMPTSTKQALIIANRDGSTLRTIKSLVGSISSATWSPDGRRLAFITEDDSIRIPAPNAPLITRVQLINADGSGLSTVASEVLPSPSRYGLEWASPTFQSITPTP